MKISFSPPYIPEESVRLVNSVLSSGWITSGPVMLELEAQLEAYLNRKCLTYNSWSSAATILLTNLKKNYPQKKYVIIPNYTYVATYNCIHHSDLIPLLIDVDDNFLMSLAQLESICRHYGNDILAIMPVEFAGFIPNYQAIRDILSTTDTNAILIGDAAHSFGSSILQNTSRDHDTDCDFLVYSMHAVKNLTSAEGGFIAFKSSVPQDFIDKMRLSRLNYQSRDAREKNKIGSWEYDISDIGFKANLPDVLAAIALGQLNTYSGLIKIRHEISEFYDNIFKNCDWAILPHIKSEFYHSNCHIYPIRIIEPTIRDNFMRFLENNAIPYNVHFKPISLMSFYSNYPNLNSYELANSIKLYTQEISLPIHHEINDEVKNYLSGKFNHFALSL